MFGVFGVLGVCVVVGVLGMCGVCVLWVLLVWVLEPGEEPPGERFSFSGEGRGVNERGDKDLSRGQQV